MNKKPKNPVKYTPDLGLKICRLVSVSPYGLDKICENHEFLPDARTIYRWRDKYPDFGQNYARAKLKQADIFAEEILNIGDKSTIDNWQHARFKVDNLKWLMSKLLPKQYGDKCLIDKKDLTDPELARAVEQLDENLKDKYIKDH